MPYFVYDKWFDRAKMSFPFICCNKLSYFNVINDLLILFPCSAIS